MILSLLKENVMANHLTEQIFLIDQLIKVNKDQEIILALKERKNLNIDQLAIILNIPPRPLN